MSLIPRGVTVSFGPAGAEPIALDQQAQVIWGDEHGAGPGVDVSRFVSSIDVNALPRIRATNLKVGQIINVKFPHSAADYLVTDVGEDGELTLVPAETACAHCERCTWNQGPDCGKAEHPHCDRCGHCNGRHDSSKRRAQAAGER